MMHHTKFKRQQSLNNKTRLRRFSVKSRQNFFRHKSDTEFITSLIDAMWDKYDIDLDGVLNKKEAKRFVRDIMDSVHTEFDGTEFSKVFVEMDLDGNGMIDKAEMV